MGDELPIQSESVEILPTLIIEGQVPKTEIPKSKTIQVPSGQGAKIIDAPVNELGIELKNMEQLEDISIERRDSLWWLDVVHHRNEWQNQIHADLSFEQNLRGRTYGTTMFGLQTVIEFGLFQDHRDLILIENNENPYNSALGNIAHYPNKRDRSYTQIKMIGQNFQVLGDMDTKTENTHAGSLLTGTKNTNQQSLSGKWILGPYNMLPFGQARQSEFSSSINSLSSNSTIGNRVGVKSEFASINKIYSVDSTLSYESLVRTFGDQSNTKFQRYDMSVVMTENYSTFFFDIKTHIGAELTQDLIDANSAPSISSRGTHKSIEPFIWDLGAEISSPKRFIAGAVGRIRRFALIPTPSQRFGDGALLMGAENLEPETGVRTSLGSWVKTDSFELEISAFYERAVNAPVMVAVSPLSARTLAIGGVWTQGVEMKATSHFGPWKIQSNYCIQNALNDSEINWQKGNPVPGRPNHIFNAGFEHSRLNWITGLNYGYQSATALDLAGLWFKEPHHDLDAYLGYKTKEWEVRLAASKLMAAQNSIPAARFEGQASPDLLEPKIEQMEVRLQCEFIM
jgi:hypothetical protein